MGKKNWELFEIEACNYLNDNIKIPSIEFRHEGSSDSTKSDIQVFYENEYLFSLEAKLSPAQSGQFVIMADEHSYRLSPLNKNNNRYSQKIVNLLNKDQEQYQFKRGDKYINLNFANGVLSDWIINHYQEKDSQFIITSNGLASDKAIFPLEEIEKYFKISAVIRPKQSGTRHLSKQHTDIALDKLNEHLNVLGARVEDVRKEKGKTYVTFANKIGLKREARYFGDLGEYYLSGASNNDTYVIKVRSNTNNLNVIFSVEYIGSNENSGIERLTQYINRIISQDDF